MPISASQPALLPDAASRAFAHPGFATAIKAGAPSIVVRGLEPQLVWANRAASDLFEVADYDGLQARLMGSGSPVAQRVRDLTRTFKEGAPPRLERLRFSWGSRARSLTALCARGQEFGGEPTLLMAFVGADVPRAKQAWLDEAQGLPLISLSNAAEDECLPAEEPTEPAGVTLTAPEPIPEVDLDPLRTALRQVLGGSHIGRFGWKTNAEGAIVQIDETLMRMLGLPLMHDEQTTLVDQVAAFDAATVVDLEQAMAEGVTWSGIEIVCPVRFGLALLPVALSASPQFDSARRFLGYRGFGRIDLSKLKPQSSVKPSESVQGGSNDGPSHRPAVCDPVVAPPMEDPLEEASPVSPPAPSTMEEFYMPGEGDLVLSDIRPEITPPNFDRSANVVQLWPVHSPPPSRPSFQTSKATTTENELLASNPFERPGGVVGGEQRTSLEAAVGRSLDRKGALTSSEHQAFQEIGRALGPGPRRTITVSDSGNDKLSASVAPEPARAAETDLTRHAAAVIDHMTVGLLVIRDKRVLCANEALREALRFESHSELLDALTIHLARLPRLGEGEPEGTVALPSAYGEPVAFASASRVLVWNGQPAILWTLVGLDGISGALPVRAEAAPAPEPARSHDGGFDLSATLDAAGEAFAVIDEAGQILWLNAQAERYFGRKRLEVHGQNFTLLMASESRAAATALLDQLKSDASEKGQLRGECVGRSTDGSSLPLEMRIAKLDDRQLAVVWRDLSAQRSIERELAQARRQAVRVGDQQPDFLANVSHQIRTPLNAILGFAEIMMDERFGSLGNARYKDYLKDIHASGTQVISLIDDLTDLSRIEAGRLDLRLGAIDINKVIADCVTQAHPLAHRERVIVRTSFGARLPPVMADERSAHQIIGNLLSNAIKFNEPGGQVIVSTASHDASSVVVRIRDTGIGMSDSDIASALEPFRQLAPTKKANGAGLGLPLTKALAGANGASLAMRSRPNEGTMVEVTFQATVPTPTRVPA